MAHTASAEEEQLLEKRKEGLESEALPKWGEGQAGGLWRRLDDKEFG